MSSDPRRHDIREAVVRSLRDLNRAGEDRERRTALYRKIAGQLVDLRALFTVPATGQPDWTGRTWEYRDFVRDIYSAAGWPRDEVPAAQKQIRYHVSRVLRERLPRETVEDLGLLAADAAARERERKAAVTAQLATLSEPAGDHLDAVRSLAAALVMLQKVTVEQVGELQGSARDQARAVLTRVERRAGELSRALM